jgi:hypothetical protein
MAEDRKHPDLFTAEEAAAYLRLDCIETLARLRKDFGLVGFTGINKSMVYWREDLDKCALRIVGRDLAHRHETGQGTLKIAGVRR